MGFWQYLSLLTEIKVYGTENVFLTITQKDRSGIIHLCNVSDYPTDPRKKWDIPNIPW